MNKRRLLVQTSCSLLVMQALYNVLYSRAKIHYGRIVPLLLTGALARYCDDDTCIGHDWRPLVMTEIWCPGRSCISHVYFFDISLWIPAYTKKDHYYNAIPPTPYTSHCMQSRHCIVTSRMDSTAYVHESVSQIDLTQLFRCQLTFSSLLQPSIPFNTSTAYIHKCPASILHVNTTIVLFR